MDQAHTKILVIDDNPALRQFLAEYLNRHGYDTFLAPDATDLASCITRYAPDLLVLDRILPGGVTALTPAAAYESNVKIFPLFC